MKIKKLLAALRPFTGLPASRGILSADYIRASVALTLHASEVTRLELDTAPTPVGHPSRTCDLFAASAFILLLLCAVRVQAQTPVLPLSFQCHWMDTTDGHMSHLHVEPTVPLGDVTTPTLEVPFVIGIFDTVGEVYEVDVIVTTAHHSTQATIVLVPPGLVGTRGQYVTFGAHATVPVPALADENYSAGRGWFMVEIAAKIALPDGVNMVTWVRRPVHALLDASQPEPALVSGATAAQSRCVYGTPHNQAQSYGQLTSQFDLLPPTDISAITPITVSGYGYGRFGAVPPATLKFVLDPNFHAGDPGTTLISKSSLDDIVHMPAAFDHPGLHKYAVIQEQTNLAGTEHAMSLLVAQVAGTPDLTPAEPPPPLTCTAPAVLTNGQCVTPPPPPPPPALTVVKIQMCAIETFSDGSLKNKCIDVP